MDSIQESKGAHFKENNSPKSRTSTVYRQRDLPDYDAAIEAFHTLDIGNEKRMKHYFYAMKDHEIYVWRDPRNLDPENAKKVKISGLTDQYIIDYLQSRN